MRNRSVEDREKSVKSELYHLAILRISLAVVLLLSYEVHNIEQFLPISKEISIWGSDWLIANVGVFDNLVSTARYFLWCGCALMLLGYWARLGIFLVLLSSLSMVDQSSKLDLYTDIMDGCIF